MQSTSPHDPEHTLWYRREAARWEEALPLGNGRLGAMVFGGVRRERIALNEDTLWSGYPRDGNPRGAAKYFPAVRDLALRGEYEKAQAVIEQKMQGADTQFYLPLGDLLLEFHGVSAPEDYERRLSLRDALCRTAFISTGVRHRREAFVSAPDQALYVRLTADRPGALSFSCKLGSLLRHRCAANKGGLSMSGVCPCGMADREHPAVYARRGDRKGMRFAVRCDLQTDGAVRACANGTLSVRGATFSVLRLFARTSYNGFDRHPFTDGLDEQALCRRDQVRTQRDFDAALTRHIRDHRRLYDRCELHLDGEQSTLPTDERLFSHQNGAEDDALYALLFHYGRYLMIAGSREGTQPMNLQGIWNEHLCAPWRGNYTLNINTEMNYWPAEICNLSECHRPLFTLIRELLQTGKRTAEAVYGARGAAAHHNTDLWRLSNPVSKGVKGSAEWAFWPMAPGWLCLHLTEHYAYTRDKKFLKSDVLPALRACARFYLDILAEGAGGRLTVTPATSPENNILYHGIRLAVTKSAQMSVSIVRLVFTEYLHALGELRLSEDMEAEARRALPRLPDAQISQHGEMLEWDAPYEEADPHHRHVSHLFDLFPGHAISPEETPALAAACRRTLNRRGDKGTGWSMAWKANLWARLNDGDKALSLLHRQLRPVTNGSEGGGSYLNLLDAHPPFQIDGNLGACSAIARMLLDSDGDKIHLLPALPGRWSGRVSGLCTPGGARTDIVFENGRAISAVVRIPNGRARPAVRYQGIRDGCPVSVQPINR